MVASASSSYDTLLVGGVALTDAETFLAFLTLPPNFLAMPLPSLVPRAFSLKNGWGHPFFKGESPGDEVALPSSTFCLAPDQNRHATQARTFYFVVNTGYSLSFYGEGNDPVEARQ